MKTIETMDEKELRTEIEALEKRLVDGKVKGYQVSPPVLFKGVKIEGLRTYANTLRDAVIEHLEPKPVKAAASKMRSTGPSSPLIVEIEEWLGKAVEHKLKGYALIDRSAYRGVKTPDLEAFRDQIKNAVEAHEAKVAEERANIEREERAREMERLRLAQEEEERLAAAQREERARKALLIDEIRPLETRLAAKFVKGVTITGLSALEAMSKDCLRERLAMLKGEEKALTTATEPAAGKPATRSLRGYKPLIAIEALGTDGQTGPTAAQLREIEAMGRRKGAEKPAEQKKDKKGGDKNKRREQKRQGRAVAA